MIYTSYDASGNDFVIFHTDDEKDYSKLAIKLCSKEYFDTDGLIVIVPHKTLDFKWLFYNNDGSIASMCGNGTRAVAHYAYANKLVSKTCTFLTGAGEISCKIDGNIVQTQMTKPIPIKEEFTEDGLKLCIIDTGVPHIVIYVEHLDKFDLKTSSKLRHEYNANVNYFTVKNNILYVRTFERGVEGETKACGTGMVACFIKALSMELISSNTTVYPSSMEQINIKKEDGILYFTGAVKQLTQKDLNI
jgi:diaminopimelate epimerase